MALPYSFIWEKFLCLLILSAFLVCFSVLTKVAMYSLESSDFVKKRSWSALQHSVPYSPELDPSGEYPICVAYALLLCWSHFSFQCSHLHWLFAWCRLCLLSVVLVGPKQASSERARLLGNLGWGGGVSKICAGPLGLCQISKVLRRLGAACWGG